MNVNDWQWLIRGKRYLAYLLIAILVGVFLQRVQEMERRAEPVLVEAMLASLQGTVMARFVRAYAGDRRDELSALEGGNPFLWGLEKPRTYAGEVDLRQTAWESLRVAHWYFDRHDGQVLYKLAHPELVEKTQAPQDQLRFQVRLERKGTTQSGTIVGVALEPVFPYRWLDEVELPVARTP